jgi:SAM-dependent methyltransferase
MDKLRELFEQDISVIREISPDDTMYQDGNKIHYFSVGQSALKCIRLAILAAGNDLTNIKNILDLPSGYGRVLRYLKAFFQDAQISACDIERGGVDFCHRVFNAKPIYSEKRPSDIRIADKFDLIWCGSLLTHLNFDRWPEFFDFYHSILNNKGILVFTAHGRHCVERIRSGNFTYGIDDVSLKILLNDFDRKGFGYINYPNVDDFGISLSSPSHVLAMLEKIFGLKLLLYFERGWDNHHDVIACVKE